MKTPLDEIKEMADLIELAIHKNHKEVSPFLIANLLYTEGYRLHKKEV